MAERWGPCSVESCRNEKRTVMVTTTPDARPTADRIGVEVERDAALADNERLRAVIREVLTYLESITAEART